MKAQAIPQLYFILTEIVIVLLAGGILYAAVANASTTVISKYLTRDLALLLTTLPAIPENAQFAYSSEKLTQEIITFKEGRVNVSKALYPYHLPETQTFQITFEKPEQLILTKQGSTLSITDKPLPLNPLAIECGNTPRITSILLDPAHGESPEAFFSGSKGKQGTIGTESELVRTIANRLEFHIKPLMPLSTTRSLERPEAKKVSERAQLADKHPGLTLTLLAGEHTDTKRNDIKLHINAKSERYEDNYNLACKIANTLSTLPSVTGISIIPFDPDRISNDNPSTPEDEDDIRHVIHHAQLGIAIELGNINTPNNPLLQPSIADTLNNAIRGMS